MALKCPFPNYHYIIIIVTISFLKIFSAKKVGIGMPRVTQYPISGSPGEPIFVTPFLKNGDIAGGQNASTVPQLVGNVKSYAGYITVNKEYNSNMFFWYFPTMRGPPKYSKTMVWLQGGPGVSGLYGLFEEIGPFLVNDQGDIQLRTVSWTKDFNVLFVDNPVGTGFSFTQSGRGYAKNEDDVARDLYSALLQFFQLFPELQSTDFYLTGESYAGKYIPAVADLIHRKNPSAAIKINLKGLFIGNGLIDPENMMHYSSYLHQLGLVDYNLMTEIRNMEDDIRLAIAAKNFSHALSIRLDILDIVQSLGMCIYDYTESATEDDFPFQEFIQRDHIRRALHVGSFIFNGWETVYHHLSDDIMQSTAHLLPELLQHYKVLLFNGQYDVADAYPLTESFLGELSWSGAYGFQATRTNFWRDAYEIAGQYKKYGNLNHVLVRKASHMVPEKQPARAYKLLKKFIRGNFW